VIVRMADPLAGDVFEAGNQCRGNRCLPVTSVAKTAALAIQMDRRICVSDFDALLYQRWNGLPGLQVITGLPQSARRRKSA
jgi:hypothetical protein